MDPARTVAGRREQDWTDPRSRHREGLGREEAEVFPTPSPVRPLPWELHQDPPRDLTRAKLSTERLRNLPHVTQLVRSALNPGPETRPPQHASGCFPRATRLARRLGLFYKLNNIPALYGRIKPCRILLNCSSVRAGIHHQTAPCVGGWVLAGSSCL